MVEVIEPAATPLPDLPHLEMPDLPNNKKRLSLLSTVITYRIIGSNFELVWFVI